MEIIEIKCAYGHSIPVPKHPQLTGYGGLGSNGSCHHCQKALRGYDWKKRIGYGEQIGGGGW